MKKTAFILSLSLYSLQFLAQKPGVENPGKGSRLLREGDLNWQKRVWRLVDVREKINHAFYYPLETDKTNISLFQLLTRHILSGEILAFRDEEFRVPYDIDEIRKKLGTNSDSTERIVFDEFGNETTIKEIAAIGEGSAHRNFCQLEIKEDWYFDIKDASMKVGILGLGFKVFGRGNAGTCTTLFYVYFPACRWLFSANFVQTQGDQIERVSFDDLFIKRMFSSTVTKESNVFDRDLHSHVKGMEVQMESDKIKQDLLRKEHDLWQY